MYPSNKKKKLWREEKERLSKLTLEERRKEYKDFVSLDKIPTLSEDLKSKASNNDDAPEELQVNSLCDKVSLYQGDITQLEVDAIVNAANSSLLGGGGVDGCIHRASGPCLFAECRSLGGCSTGQAKITCGYELPAKYVIHTVGPIARGHLNENHKMDLANCYQSSLKLAKEFDLRSIAFPCISTGIYGFPNEPAATIALNNVKEWLKKNHNEIDRVIFCVFLDVDFKIYKKELTNVFLKDDDNKDEDDIEDDDGQKEDEQMNEVTGKMEQKPKSPPMKKYKAKKSENSQDDQEEKDTVSSEDMKDLNQTTEDQIPSPKTPEGKTDLPEENFPDEPKEINDTENEERITERKGSQGQEDLKENEDTDETDVTMESQGQDDINRESTLNSPVDEVKDPVNINQMTDEEIDLCQETSPEVASCDVEMCSQNITESSGGNEKNAITED
ncbi:ADP-ribose glycohydrolase MACROD2 isoform X2 [Pelobates fuscus]|uniref:ADP-ribose glycohydrolase MACROD2 isoform X2 n=1 Tax=Pelobates fuscus TaxID=191477 RepID=UPI002FE4BB5E